MFLGGFTNRLKVLLFAATLPEGAPLSSTAWPLVTDPSSPGQAVPLTSAPPRGQWDARRALR